MRRAAALLALAFLSCRERPTFTCATNSQCGAGGVCLMSACAFADAACPSGLRWDVSAPGRARACVDAPDMASPVMVDDMAAPAPGPDLATSMPPVDLAAPPADLVSVVHFYPTLEAQIEQHSCLNCHTSPTPQPQLKKGDTPEAMANYQVMLGEKDAVVQALQDVTHCAHGCFVMGADLDAWRSWVQNPIP